MPFIFFFSLASPDPVNDPDLQGNWDKEFSHEASERFRILLLGRYGTGKSSLLKQFKTSEYLNPFQSETDDSEIELERVNVILDNLESTLDFVEFNVDQVFDFFVFLFFSFFWFLFFCYFLFVFSFLMKILKIENF